MTQEDILNYVNIHTEKIFISIDFEKALNIGQSSIAKSLKQLRKTEFINYKKINNKFIYWSINSKKINNPEFVKLCLNCNKPFMFLGEYKKYCSKKCQRRFLNAKK